ncbi:MAG: SufS family cysteine desulfurase [Defluviitaleaceae bacterium]|nr:SufS family cysteine desulfurase [Defluviitaleaceae bacterium]
MSSLQTVRDDFKILNETMNGKPLVYLDSSATSLKPNSVVEAIEFYNTKKTANVHRGVYKLGNEATELYEGSRHTVAKFINAKSSNEIVFTKGCTEALNLVAMSLGHSIIEEGDEIITSELEHHSSFLPWQWIANHQKAKLVFVPLTEDGRITVENFKSVLSERTKVVALTYVSNVMGYITPIKEIIKLAHSVGALVSVDAAQASPHIKIDVQNLDCDFLSFTGHKMLGPTGIGVLYGKYSLLEKMEPISFGGEMIDLVDLNGSTFKNPPYKFEAGTPVIGSAIGLKAAIDYINKIGFDAIQKHEIELREYAIDLLSKIEGVNIYNTVSDVGIINFNIEDVHPHDMASVYDNHGVCVRAGHHCTQLFMKWLKAPATLRASIYIYNTKEDIDALVAATISGKDIFLHGIF